MEEISNQIHAVESIFKRREESESDMSPELTRSKLGENEVGASKCRTERK